VQSDYQRWRVRARRLLQRGVAPSDVDWTGGLFDGDADQAPTEPTRASIRVPPAVVDLLERVACHRDSARHALMYRLLWRVTHGEHGLLDDAADDDVVRLARMAKAVDRASHKMTAFLRFREVRAREGVSYVGWFEPEHRVLARTAPFFARRFGTMVWTIATPDGGAHWDRRSLTCFDVDPSIALPAEDATEALWLAYYESIFNPARLNLDMMRKEMPVAYWKNLPEARRIPALVADANARAARMIDTTLDRDVAPYGGMACGRASRDTAASSSDLPVKATLDACRRCPLGARATQAVAGSGPLHAPVMLVGEQPGDEEDLSGKPFVGPAGRLLRRALDDAGVEAESVYITNAVKHFSYEPRGKRRIHKTPAQREIEACRHWLEAEILRVKPAAIVALGGTALYALLDDKLKVGEARTRELVLASGTRVIATYHPAAILRAVDENASARLYGALVEDLRSAVALASDAEA
jgi:DNA polymerase